MSILKQTFESVKPEVNIDSQGRVTLGIGAASRLLGIAKSTLSEGVRNPNSRLINFLATQGIEPFVIADFGSKGIPDTALAVIAQYYAFMANRKTEQAQQLCMAFMAVGIRAWVHDQLGWKKEQPQPYRPALQAYTRRVLDIQKSVRDLPEDYWCVFVEAAQLLILVENNLTVPIDKYDLLDGSIGKHWSQYRDGKPWAGVWKTYNYDFADSRKVQKPKCYPNKELLEFRRWLEVDYKVNHLPNYLRKKYGNLVKL